MVPLESGVFCLNWHRLKTTKSINLFLQFIVFIYKFIFKKVSDHHASGASHVYFVAGFFSPPAVRPCPFFLLTRHRFAQEPLDKP